MTMMTRMTRQDICEIFQTESLSAHGFSSVRDSALQSSAVNCSFPFISSAADDCSRSIFSHLICHVSASCFSGRLRESFRHELFVSEPFIAQIRQTLCLCLSATAVHTASLSFIGLLTWGRPIHEPSLRVEWVNPSCVTPKLWQTNPISILRVTVLNA